MQTHRAGVAGELLEPLEVALGDQARALGGGLGCHLSALLVALDQWTAGGKEPPASRLPRRADGTLVPVERVAQHRVKGGGDSGLAWAEGSLWVGHYRERKIHQVDPETGVVLRSIESNRFVTGVSWVDGELWHATWEGDESELRRIDPRTGEVLEALEMPAGTNISGLESDGADRFFCGGGDTGKLRAVRRPGRRARAA